MLTICKREIESYFHTMIGYVLIAFMIAFTGIYFMVYNLNYGYPYFSYVLVSVDYIVLLVVPVLTMRSFAEEMRSKTDQLLLTSPVGLFQIVMGKYLAMVAIFAIPCVVYLLFPLIILAQGTAYILEDYLAIFMFFLLGCVFIAIGMFLSSLTKSQILAAVGTFGVLLIVYLWSGILGFLPTSAGANAIGLIVLLSLLVFLVWQMTKNWLITGILEGIVVLGTGIVYLINSELFESLLSDVLGDLDLVARFSNIVNDSIFDVTGVIFYLTIIGLFIFLTMQMIQRRRWS